MRATYFEVQGMDIHGVLYLSIALLQSRLLRRQLTSDNMQNSTHLVLRGRTQVHSGWQCDCQKHAHVAHAGMH